MLKKLLEVLRIVRKRGKAENKGTIMHVSMSPEKWTGKRVRREDLEIQSIYFWDV